MYFKIGSNRKLGNEILGVDENESIFWEAIEKYYCAISRFKGETMDLSSEGQDILTQVILSRTTRGNIGSIAEILSSNGCENCFSVLT